MSARNLQLFMSVDEYNSSQETCACEKTRSVGQYFWNRVEEA